MGEVGCAVFLGELGNREYFHNPRQIIKFAGYDPKENDSGSRVGRKIISKKGRRLLRKCLFFMVLETRPQKLLLQGTLRTQEEGV